MRRDRTLRGARVVITGSLGGIGRAITRLLEEEGARVVGIDLAAEPGTFAADVRDPDQVKAAMSHAARELGGIDILINNAGIGCAQDSGALPDDDARATMDVNFFGAWNCCSAALPHLLTSAGQVINVASGLALVDVPFAVAYSASKRALAAYSAALRLEYRDRLTVTTIYPGYIRTSIHERAARSGVSLEGIVRPDGLETAAAAIVRACKRRPASASTSSLTTLELWSASRFPRITGTVMSRRFRRWARERPAPAFLRYPDPAAWGPAETTPRVDLSKKIS